MILLDLVNLLFLVRVHIYLTKIGKVIISLIQFGKCFTLAFIYVYATPFTLFWSILFSKRMNVHYKSDKCPNKHEQIDFEGVEEELCLIISQ